MRHPLFQDPNLQTQFEVNGFVVIPLLQADELEELVAIYREVVPEDPPGFYSTSFLHSTEEKIALSRAATPIIQEKLKPLFQNYRLIGSAYLSKSPGPESNLPLHQDWTIVEESVFCAANVWTPLTTITSNNGPLQVLPGSHRSFQALRAPTLPFCAKGFEERIVPHLQSLQVQPGEVVVLNQALVHRSPPNESDTFRLALTTGVVSKEAPLLFHYWDQETKELERYHMADDFQLEFTDFMSDIRQRPQKGELQSSQFYEFEPLTEHEFCTRMGIEICPEVEEPVSWYRKFISRFS